jgi:streptogramin lyase
MLKQCLMAAAFAFGLVSSQIPSCAANTDSSREKAIATVRLPKGFRYEPLVMGDIPEPVALKFAPDGRLWFTGSPQDKLSRIVREPTAPAE